CPTIDDRHSERPAAWGDRSATLDRWESLDRAGQQRGVATVNAESGCLTGLDTAGASLQAAVKGAVAKHRKFKVDVPNAVTVAYLIRGIPVPEAIVSAVTLSETQAFATDIAAHIAGAVPEALGVAARAPAPEGAVLS